MVLVAGGGQGADADAMEAVGKADDVAAAGDLARQFQRRLDGVGAGGAGELHYVLVQATGFEDQSVEDFKEALLGCRVHVQTVGQAIVLQVFDQRLLQYRVVVTIVKRAGTGKEVDIGLAFGGDQLGATGLIEDHREGTAVAANTGLVLFELLEGVHADS